MDSNPTRISQRHRRGVAMFVVLGVVVFVTMLGFMGLMMARNDALGSGDVLSARSTEAAAFSGINLALASLASDPAQTATILNKFVVDSASTTPRAWFNFDPASGPFDLVTTSSVKSIVAGTGDYSVEVRILSLDIGGAAGVPAGGIKITLSSTGTGRSGDKYTTVASYRILGIDVARIVDVANTGLPTHALYLGGSLNNASGDLETQGSVYVSGDYAGNSGANTIHGRLKIGGNMNLPSGNPQTIDSNTWIGGSLTVNSGNRLHYKMNLGVGRGLCLMNDSVTVDSSFNLYGTCPSSLTWQNERQIRVNGKQFLLRDQVWANLTNCDIWWPVHIVKFCPDPVRRGRLVVPSGRAFLNTGIHTADGADPSSYPSDSIRFLRLGASSGATGCGGMASYAGRQVRVDTIYSHTVCSLTVKTTGSPAPALIVNQAARLGYVKAGRIAVGGGGTGWSYASSNLPAGHNATGTWIYGGANDNVVPVVASKGLLELGVPAIDTMAALADNPPNTIDLSPTMVAKLQRVSRLRVQSGVTAANLSEAGTGRYINRMIDTASKYGLLHNGYLLLWIDEAINIKYNANTDLIKGRVLYVIDRAVSSGFNWPPSKDSGAIQILYFPRAQTKHDTTFAGTGSFGSDEFGLVDGDFYGYLYSEILMNIRTKFDTEFRGAIAFTVTGSSMEMQASGKGAANNTLNVILDKNVFTDIQSKLGVIKDPTGSTGTPTLVVSRANGFVVRQSKLQFVPMGEYR